MLTVSENLDLDGLSQMPTIPYGGEILKAGAQAAIQAFRGYVKVHDAAGNPVQGAKVSLASVRGFVPVPIAQATTDANGMATLIAANVPTGQQLIYMISRPGEKKVVRSVKAEHDMTVVATLPPVETNWTPWVVGGIALIGGWLLFSNRE